MAKSPQNKEGTKERKMFGPTVRSRPGKEESGKEEKDMPHKIETIQLAKMQNELDPAACSQKGNEELVRKTPRLSARTFEKEQTPFAKTIGKAHTKKLNHALEKKEKRKLPPGGGVGGGDCKSTTPNDVMP